MYEEAEVIATIAYNTDGDGRPPTVLKSRDVTRCKRCRWYKNSKHYCGLFGTDKDPEGFCDEGLPSHVEVTA